MNLEGARIWLATRGGERAVRYQSDLLAALGDAKAASVEVVGLDDLVRSMASDLSSRATDLLENAADRLARGLRINRLLGRDDKTEESGDVEEPETHPDLIVLDDARLLSGLRALLRVARFEPLIVALIDDLRVDTRWRTAPVHAYILPDESLRPAHVATDSLACVEIAGPPVARTYESALSAAEAKSQLGLDAEQTVLLIAAQGSARQTIEKAIFQLTLIDSDATILFHYGTDEERADVLRAAAADYGLQAQIFGQIDDLTTAYAAADVLLAGADDPTVLELLLARRPVVLVGPDRGAARAQYLADAGAVIHVEDVLQLGTRLDQILAREDLSATIERAAALIKPSGTADVVAALARLYADRALLLGAPEEEPTVEVPIVPSSPAPEADEEGTAPPRPSPFETIGAVKGSADSAAGLPPISMAEAKAQMAELIVKERDAERRQADAVRARDVWLGRLELAQEGNDTQLAEVAEVHLATARGDVARLNREIEAIRRSKEKLKTRVARPKSPATPRRQHAEPATRAGLGLSSDFEARFRRMEVERDMARLRRKIRDEE